MASSANEHKITYKFRFPDEKVKVFEVRLEAAESCLHGSSTEGNYPEWTELSYQKCMNCPLDPVKHRYCPAAVSLIDVVEFFQESHSVDQAKVSVRTKGRQSEREMASIFPAISSLMGLYMATSGCPILDNLRPMARFHLPFAGTEETVYRALSMYALAQHFRARSGLEVDLDFHGLKEIYQQINQLNRDFSKRLKNGSISEATTNALVSLDCFAQEIDFSISEDMLEEIETLFQTYLQ